MDEKPATIFKAIASDLRRGQRQAQEIAFIPTPAETPTNFLPGTPEKIAVMINRVKNGEALWADGDPVLDDNPNEVELTLAKIVVAPQRAQGTPGVDKKKRKIFAIVVDGSR